MSAVGSANNVAWGFVVSDTSVLSVGGSSVGMIDGAITVSVPRDVRFLRADQYAAPIDATVVTKDAMIRATIKEMLGANIVHGWGTGSYTGSSVVVDSNDEGEVAVVVVTNAPDGATTTITMSKAYSVGDGTYNVPFADGQSMDLEFQGIGDTANSGRILALVHS